jgi:DNA adenine methylase
MQKPRSYAEIYNDIDSEIVNVFEVLRDPEKSKDLERLIRLTPFARDEFNAVYEPAFNQVEQARRTIFKSFAGHGSDSIHRKKPTDNGMFTRISTSKAPTGFRSDSNRSGTTPAHDWARWPEHIGAFCERLQGVVIENRPAIKVIEQYDKEDALIYVDPPYPRNTRKHKYHGYRHEMTEEEHKKLAQVLRSVHGMVIVSGYACDLYDQELYPDWRRCEKHTRTYGKGEGATEVLWISPNTPENYPGLFPEEQNNAPHV